MVIIYYVPCIVLYALHLLMCLILSTLLNDYYCNPHFIDEKTEAQSG